uniref:Uncharacterized protein n=1 Tax=Rhizophora mucronata TaxID=61149 RepID=A0A2P2J312_RHIMU
MEINAYSKTAPINGRYKIFTKETHPHEARKDCFDTNINKRGGHNRKLLTSQN